MSNATLSPTPYLHSVRLIIHIMLDKALPHKRHYGTIYEAFAVSASKVLPGQGVQLFEHPTCS